MFQEIASISRSADTLYDDDITKACDGGLRKRGILVVGKPWQVVLDIWHFDVLSIFIITAQFKHERLDMRRDLTL